MHHWRVVCNWSKALFVFILLAQSMALHAQGMADTLEQKIENAIDQERIIDDLGTGFRNSPSGEFVLLPKSKDLRYAILIYNIDILPDRAVFSAGMAFRETKSNQLIAFQSSQIAFSFKHGLSGAVALYLVDSVKVTLGNAIDLLFIGGSSNTTFAEWDCSGLKEFSIHGNAILNTDIVVPVNDTGASLPDRSVTVEFQARAKSWNDFILNVSLPRFEIKGLPGYVFSVRQATLDLSETANTGGMRLPDIYEKNQLLTPIESVWEGFYLGDIQVTIPSYFKHQNKKTVSFGVSDCIIDEFGFSGKIYGQNVLPFEHGDLGGWNVSINKIEIELILNRLRVARLSGDIGMPVLPDTSRLRYLAAMDFSGNYLFTVATNGTLSIPALKVSELKLAKNSFVLAEIRDSRIFLQAELHGVFTTSAKGTDAENAKYQLPDIQFRGLQVRNQGVKFAIEYLGITRKTDSARFAGFPVQLQRIAFASNKNEHYLEANFGINLTEYAAASTGIKVYCAMHDELGRQRLRFKSIGVSSVDVAFEKSGISVLGSLRCFKEDLTYGNGISGEIWFALKEPALKAKAKAIFGSVANTRYWYFDAELSWPAPGIPITPGLNINGFSGGAWHRLRPWDGKEANLHPEYGTTASGTVFVPDHNGGLGLKAGIFLNGGSEKSYAAKVILEMQFSKNAGLSRVMFYGDLEVMPEYGAEKGTATSLLPSIPASGKAWDNYCKSYLPKAQIGGPFMLVLDFKNRNYTSAGAIYLKQAAGNTINGAYKNHKAGEVQAYFDAQKWFVHIGTPKQPLSVICSVAKNPMIKASVYLVAGHELPKAPEPPAEIRYALGNNLQLDVGRNLQAISSGRGFAYGASFEMEARAMASDKKIGVYASLRSLAAMDINVMHYPGNTICKSTGNVPGKNGWYGNGNLYAFFQGKVGASVGAFKMDVMTLTGAMAFSVSAPNPLYGYGVANIEFRISSIIKFKGDLKIEFGEACDPQVIKMADSSLIRKILPLNNAREVDPLTQVGLEFAVPVQKIFTAAESKKYAFRCRKLALLHAGIEIPGKWKFSEDGLSASFLRDKQLPPSATLEIQVELDLVDVASGNKQILDQKGKPLEEVRAFFFKTGAAPTTIPASNIAFAYPGQGQVNFYRKQYAQGFVQLRIPQPDILQTKDSKLIARFSSFSSDKTLETNVNSEHGKLYYAFPKDLTANTIYRIRIIRVDVNYAVNSGNISAGNGYQSSSNGQSALNKNSGNATMLVPKVLLEYWFRCSYFDGFEQKARAMQMTRSHFAANGVASFQMKNELPEYWDQAELDMFEKGARPVLDIYQMPWYKSYCQTRVYNLFGIIPAQKLLNRDTSIMGCPAVRSIQVHQDGPVPAMLQNENIFQNKPVKYGCEKVDIACNLVAVTVEDLESIKRAILRMNGSVGKTEQMAINQFVAGHRMANSPASGSQNSGTSSSPSNSAYAAKNQGKTNLPGNFQITIPTTGEIQAIRLTMPGPKATFPVMWRYQLPDGKVQHISTSKNIKLP